MHKPAYFLIPLTASILLFACPSTNPVCDTADKLDLASKTNDCVGLDAGRPLQDHTSCNAKIHGCNANDQSTLDAMLNCLNNLDKCQRNTQSTWEQREADCFSAVSGLSQTCKDQFFPTGAGGGSGGGAGGGGSSDAGRETLPCDVAAFFGTWCGKCHSNPPANAAPYPLVKRSDVTQTSPADPMMSVGQRCVFRLQQTTLPMPPAPEPVPSAAEIAVVSNWVSAGMPDGVCTVDGGTPDAGPAPVTCQGTQTQPPLTSAGPEMAPGWACVSCHQGSNFDNQNPQGYTAFSRAYFFMGTVFPDWHENDLCIESIPSGVSIDIFDSNGAAVLNLPVNAVGNFYSHSLSAGISLPYTARLNGPNGTRTMVTPQMSGDCNTCHTVQGLQGAPGRITLP